MTHIPVGKLIKAKHMLDAQPVPDDYVISAPREHQDTKGLIRTFTGKYVNPLALRPEDIDILDIAHHLSIINRYTGASPEPFSVAQHSVMAAGLIVDNRALKLAVLLHDAAEAYFNDLASPVKRDPRMQWYVNLEHDATELIFRVFGLDPALLPLTKAADDYTFRREASSWWGLCPTREKIVCWSARRAEVRFLQLFGELA